MRRLGREISKWCMVSGSCAVLCLPIFAEEPPKQAPPEPVVEHLDVENLGDALLESGTMESGSLDAAEAAVEPPVVTGAPGRSSRWKVSPRFELKATYDDNIFITPDDQVEDFIVTAAPGIAVGYWDDEEEMVRYLDRKWSAGVIGKGSGNFLLVDYTAILLGFAKTSSQNAFDQDGQFSWRWNFGRLTVGGNVHAESKSETNADVGGRIHRKTLAAEVSASWQLTGKSALEIALFNTHNDPEDFVRTVEWRGEAYISYAITPLVKAGLGVSSGRVNVESGDDRTFEQVFAGAAYSLGEKLEVGVRGGVEFRQSDGLADDLISPIFELRADWLPVSETRIGVNAFRHLGTSSLRPDQDILLTGVTLTVERELRSGLHFSVGAGYQVSDYTAGLGDDDRTDRYFFVRPGVLYNFARWGNARVSYAYLRNNSDVAGSSFQNNQISLEVSLIY
jgi:predicted porin